MSLVLVVDDEPDVRMALVTLLKAEGHDVFEAKDGSELLPAVWQKRPDLILLDVSMPKMDGFEALRLLRARPDTRDISVIIVTAKGRPEHKALGRELGISDYICKPWSDGEVELRTKWALHRSGLDVNVQRAPREATQQAVPG